MNIFDEIKSGLLQAINYVKNIGKKKKYKKPDFDITIPVKKEENIVEEKGPRQITFFDEVIIENKVESVKKVVRYTERNITRKVMIEHLRSLGFKSLSKKSRIDLIQIYKENGIDFPEIKE